jgi:hypothetical protein
VAVVVANNQRGAPFPMPGNFSSVSIPAMLITQEDGARLKDSTAATIATDATLKIGPRSQTHACKRGVCACARVSSDEPAHACTRAAKRAHTISSTLRVCTCMHRPPSNLPSRPPALVYSFVFDSAGARTR